MRRIFDAYAYGEGPRAGCWWDETSDVPPGDNFEGAAEVDVAIIGGGFTGLCAALRLAEAGTSVAVFEAEKFGWGASGRNAGFCCLGGGIASDDALDRRFGRAARVAFRQAEIAAVRHVEDTITRLNLDVDRHSEGETQLAHRPRDMTALRRSVASVRENYGVEPVLIEKSELAAHGMTGGPFFGAMTIPLGFGLNPRKYLAGLVVAAHAAGVLLYDRAPVTQIKRAGTGHRLVCGGGSVRAAHVLIATNGYSSEDVPESLAGRYMPGQSTVLVTRPIRQDELEAQGWTTAQMSYDTRNLLHY
ncbi:MAG: FAD-binding oxidoreductase, partial [Roseobacter sp.]|nr:FAD-binding oxidoreductase [Roseobacter sp.]